MAAPFSVELWDLSFFAFLWCYMTFSSRLRWPIPTERSNPWFNAFTNLIRSMDSSVYALRENDCIVIGGGGTVSFNAGTNVLSWTAPIKLNAAISGFFWSVAASSLTVVDGAYIYVTLSRSPSANQVVVFETSSRIPNTDPVLFVAQRQGSRIYWRNGSILQDGDSLELFLMGPTGSGGGGAGASAVWGVSGLDPVVEYKFNGDRTATGGVLPSFSKFSTDYWCPYHSSMGLLFDGSGQQAIATDPSFIITGDMTLAIAVRVFTPLLNPTYWLAGVTGDLNSELSAENCLGALTLGDVATFNPTGNVGLTYFVESGGGTDYEIPTTFHVSNGDPVLLAFTRSGTTVTLYANDLIVGSGTVPAPTDGSNGRIEICGSNPFLYGYFPGCVYGFWLYNSALTQDQIRTLWQNRVPRSVYG